MVLMMNIGLSAVGVMATTQMMLGGVVDAIIHGGGRK
jgi:hypothetical protein